MIELFGVALRRTDVATGQVWDMRKQEQLGQQPVSLSYSWYPCEHLSQSPTAFMRPRWQCLRPLAASVSGGKVDVAN